METTYDLVVILVDEATWNATASDGRGLLNFFGGTPRFSQKIETYARDVQAALPWTKTLILTLDDNEGPVEIQKTLERLYLRATLKIQSNSPERCGFDWRHPFAGGE